MKKEPITKKKIKEAALYLFNKEGTLPTSTNHIAKHANISTGNLYYHYKNKEDIIEEIYIQMIREFDEFDSYELVLKNENPLKVISLLYDEYCKLFYKYRFMMRDSLVLIALYKNIKDIFVEREKIRVAKIERIIRYFIENDIYIPMNEEDIKLRAKMTWFISSYWQNFITVGSKITKESIKDMKNIVFKTNIIPYLTSKGELLLDEI